MRIQTTINTATKKQVRALTAVRKEMATIWQYQEKQGDVLVAVEASVHKLTIQNVEEIEEEREPNLITMDESPNVQVSMLIAPHPILPSILGFVPMVGSNMMVSDKEAKLPLGDMDDIGSRLVRA